MVLREADYAIRIIIAVAQKNGKIVPASEIAQRMNIPYRFLRKISLTLVKHGILQSRRGSGGGLYLAKSPKDITLLDVITIFSNHGTGINLCLRDEASCNFTNTCPVLPRLREIQHMIDDRLRAIVFSDLLEESSEFPPTTTNNFRTTR